jgi:hypothetical protein
MAISISVDGVKIWTGDRFEETAPSAAPPAEGPPLRVSGPAGETGTWSVRFSCVTNDTTDFVQRMQALAREATQRSVDSVLAQNAHQPFARARVAAMLAWAESVDANPHLSARKAHDLLLAYEKGFV